MFDSLGLTADLLAVYRTVLHQPELTHSSRRQELADQLGLSEDDTGRELEKLRELGLLVPGWIEGWEYPLDPSIAFERLAARRQREIDDLSNALRSDQLAVGKFISDHANSLVQKSTRDAEILEGRERANQRMQHFEPTTSMWRMIQPDADPIINREKTSLIEDISSAESSCVICLRNRREEAGRTRLS